MMVSNSPIAPLQAADAAPALAQRIASVKNVNLADIFILIQTLAPPPRFPLERTRSNRAGSTLRLPFCMTL
jgi:hypothetical protein